MFAGSLASQAPPLTELWRVASSTLPVPAALASGPAAVFWNPAAPADHAPSRAAAIEILETPDVLALSGFVAAAHWRLTRHLIVGTTLGRMAISDLVRTTTSPVAVQGDILVHSQIVGVSVGWNGGPVAIGILARAHESRLDALRDGGLTTDAGIRWHPVSGVTLAASSRFLAPDLGRNESTELNVGLGTTVPIGMLWGSAADVQFSLGAGWHGTQRAEPGGGAALGLSDRLTIGWGLTHERAFGESAWRNALGLSFRTSHYAIIVARADGLNGLGATYRLGLAAGTDR